MDIKKMTMVELFDAIEGTIRGDSSAYVGHYKSEILYSFAKLEAVKEAAESYLIAAHTCNNVDIAAAAEYLEEALDACDAESREGE